MVLEDNFIEELDKFINSRGNYSCDDLGTIKHYLRRIDYYLNVSLGNSRREALAKRKQELKKIIDDCIIGLLLDPNMDSIDKKIKYLNNFFPREKFKNNDINSKIELYLVNRIESEIKNLNFQIATHLLKSVINVNEHTRLSNYLKETYDKNVIILIKNLVKKNNFKEAFELLKKIDDNSVKAKAEEVYFSTMLNFLNTQIQNSYIIKIIDDIKFYIENANKHNVDNFKLLLSDYDNFCKQLRTLLEAYDFKNADKLFYSKQNYIDENTYLDGKAICIKRFLNSICDKIDLNKEQSKAIALSSVKQNTLLTARAGSGKTSTIASRAIYAIEKEGYDPNEIMILAFNKKAAGEIRERINDRYNYKKFNIKCARTFHSLAYSIEHPEEDIIYDDPYDDVKQELTNFVAELYHSKDIWTETFKKLYYLFFRVSSELEEYWKHSSKEERYENYRQKKYITLSGKHVKSNGEKWIADFLFEHEISFQYEKVLTGNKDGLYRPDFTIYDDNKKATYIVEHWGIDEFDSTHSVPENWTKTWFEYKKEMQWKRELCNRKKVTLIETSIRDMKNGREEFEKILKRKLESVGIKCIKLPFNILIGKIDSRNKDEIAKRFARFIQSAHKSKLTANDIISSYERYHLSKSGNAFVELAVQVLDKYEKRLKEEKRIDFDVMFTRATEKARKMKCECQILLSKDGNIRKKLKDIKLLLIDEYQDFSDMFYELLSEIRKSNKDLKLFCVGDDWQAINGFAGSNTKYFTDFINIFPNSCVSTLTTNYRSGLQVVECGNQIMQGCGVSAKCYQTNLPSNLYKIFVDDVSIYDKYGNVDKQYIYDNNIGYFDANHRYFKIIYNIIKNNPSKSYFIMHRKSEPSTFGKLSDLKKALLSKLNKDGIKVKLLDLNTIHKFKGNEADVVIILEADNDNIPLLHPDSEIEIIFGRTEEDILEEERHLFYVAVTRAKQDVYFMCEKQKESEYLKKLDNICELHPNSFN